MVDFESVNFISPIVNDKVIHLRRDIRAEKVDIDLMTLACEEDSYRAVEYFSDKLHSRVLKASVYMDNKMEIISIRIKLVIRLPLIDARPEMRELDWDEYLLKTYGSLYYITKVDKK